MTLSVGTRLGPYEIVAPLGAGGMGEVYRARDRKLKRDVAVKVLPESLATDAEALARFERETLAVAALSHPNILAIHDFGKEEEISFAVMELLEGETLRGALTAGALPQRKAVDYAVQIARGLAAAHEKGIVHRDLKPENLFVTREGHIKILDFGLAKQARPKRAGDTSAPTERHATEPGTVLGTVGYMSPEQVRGEAADHRSDIFSFGTVLYEMLSGKRAFQGGSPVETMNAILINEPAGLSQVSEGVPSALERIVGHCLEKKPEQRFQSTRDVAFALEALSGSGSPIGPTAARRQRRRLWPALLAGALVLLLAGVVSYRKGEKAALSAASRVAFRQITFQRGTIWSARFAPDGETVVYGAAWEGRPVEPFLTRLGGPESRALGFPGAEILAVSSPGELALSLGRRSRGGWIFSGTLARVALAGGTPRPVMEDVEYADWSPDGSELAVVRSVGGKYQLEYPIGKVLYSTSGWISHARVSPRGDLVAFLDHPLPGDDRGSVAVVDRIGKTRILCGEWESEQGLAWTPSGEEVWFTRATTGHARALHAAPLSGGDRAIASVPGMLLLHDISRTGRVLLGREGFRTAILSLSDGARKERDISALDWSIAVDLSPDGRSILISEQGRARARTIPSTSRGRTPRRRPSCSARGTPWRSLPTGPVSSASFRRGQGSRSSCRRGPGSRNASRNPVSTTRTPERSCQTANASSARPPSPGVRRGSGSRARAGESPARSRRKG